MTAPSLRRAGVLSLLAALSPFLTALCAPSDPSAPQPGDNPGVVHFAVVSDVHFDPFQDPASLGVLTQASFDRQARNRYAALIASHANRVRDTYGEKSRGVVSDSSLLLILSALTNLAAQGPPPAFVLTTGDFIAHHFRDQALAAGISNTTALIRHAEDVVAGAFEDALPGIPVFPTLGNNDSSTGAGDYAEPDEPFLRSFARSWERLVARNPAIATSFSRDFSTAGGYVVNIPDLPPLILFNSALGSTRFKDLQGRHSAEAGRATLDWIAEAIRGQTRPGPLWFAYHVPPGVDPYPDSSKHYWMQQPEDLGQRFLDLLAGSHSVSFCGHTHREEFRVLFTEARPVGLVHIAPSVSPCFRNNPAYQLFSFHKDDGSLDYQTVYLSNFSAMATNPLTTWSTFRPEWKREAPFSATYGQGRYTAAHAAVLLRELASLNPSVYPAYLDNYAVRHPAGQYSLTNSVARYWEDAQLHGRPATPTAGPR